MQLLPPTTRNTTTILIVRENYNIRVHQQLYILTYRIPSLALHIKESRRVGSSQASGEEAKKE